MSEALGKLACPACERPDKMWENITGWRSAGNQDMTTRSTLMNTSASPTPSTARAASAAGYESRLLVLVLGPSRSEDVHLRKR